MCWCWTPISAKGAGTKHSAYLLLSYCFFRLHRKPVWCKIIVSFCASLFEFWMFGNWYLKRTADYKNGTHPSLPPSRYLTWAKGYICGVGFFVFFWFWKRLFYSSRALWVRKSCQMEIRKTAENFPKIKYLYGRPVIPQSIMKLCVSESPQFSRHCPTICCNGQFEESTL